MRAKLLFGDFEDAKMIITADNDTMSTTVRIEALTSAWENGWVWKKLAQMKEDFLAEINHLVSGLVHINAVQQQNLKASSFPSW